MKYKSIFLAFVITVSLSSCSLFTSAVEGDSNVTKKVRNVGSFSGVELEGIGNIILTQGSQSVEIETDSNLQDLIKTKIEDGNLVIYQDENIEPSKLEIYVSTPTISEIELNGSGSIICQSDLKGDELDIELDGSGDIRLAGVKYDELELELDGSGDVNIAGSLDYAKIELDGSGDIYMSECEIDEAKVELDGSGNISLKVMETIHAEINGSGDIKYTGNPSEVRAKSNGSGNIIKVD